MLDKLSSASRHRSANNGRSGGVNQLRSLRWMNACTLSIARTGKAPPRRRAIAFANENHALTFVCWCDLDVTFDGGPCSSSNSNSKSAAISANDRQHVSTTSVDLNRLADFFNRTLHAPFSSSADLTPRQRNVIRYVLPVLWMTSCFSQWAV